MVEAKILERPNFKINAVHHSDGQSSPNNAAYANRSDKNRKFSDNSDGKLPPNNCFRCGELHWAQNCPNKNQLCSKCNRRGHIKQQCDKIQAYHQNKRKFLPKINIINLPAAFKNQGKFSKPLKAKILVNGKQIKFKLDSAADVNVINEAAFKAIGQPKIQYCPDEAQLFDGTRFKFIGRGIANFQFNGTQAEQQFYLAKNGTPNILGVATLDQFGFLEEMKRLINASNPNQISSEIPAKIKDNFQRLNAKIKGEGAVGSKNFGKFCPALRTPTVTATENTSNHRKFGTKSLPPKTGEFVSSQRHNSADWSPGKINQFRQNSDTKIQEKSHGKFCANQPDNLKENHPGNYLPQIGAIQLCHRGPDDHLRSGPNTSSHV
ncbi:hypothetical protein niasHT_028301 [Heterodera trifolii]|uniref:CCHC-type domain-containing protein n=1 Tax=Heterodera trifolii TaxID=157864 RepID=A0ABD2JW04_9BILA